MAFASNLHPQQNYWKNITAPPALPNRGAGMVDGLDDIQRNFGDPQEALRVDKTDPLNVYLGFIMPQWNRSQRRVFFPADTAKAMWLIVKIEQDGAGNIARLYPQGSRDYTFVWDDRATYTYL